MNIKAPGFWPRPPVIACPLVRWGARKHATPYISAIHHRHRAVSHWGGGGVSCPAHALCHDCLCIQVGACLVDRCKGRKEEARGSCMSAYWEREGATPVAFDVLCISEEDTERMISAWAGRGRGTASPSRLEQGASPPCARGKGVLQRRIRGGLGARGRGNGRVTPASDSAVREARKEQGKNGAPLVDR